MSPPTPKKKTAKRKPDAAHDVDEVTAWLERRGTKKQIAELDRYGIAATRPFGVTVGDLKKHAKTLGRDHALALALWETGRYEARMLAAFVGEPEKVTLTQMNRWVADCDNWALVDNLCFHLFDRTPHAWKKIPTWSKARAEFTKRTAFALLWSLSVHDKESPDRRFEDALALFEPAAGDDRHLVKKSIDMALRAIGKRSPALNAAALKTAARLAASDDANARWIGTHAARELESPAVKARLKTPPGRAKRK